MIRVCEICNIEIPADYGNALCDEHYKALVEETDRLKARDEEDRKEREVAQLGEPPSHGITDPEYHENPEKEYPWDTNIHLFYRTGKALYHDRVAIYNLIKNYCFDIVKAHPQYPKYIWKPKVVDIGCSIGIGTNIMSQEADFIWGIDRNEQAIKLATQLFARNKNNFYWSPQISFDQVDITAEPREIQSFDIVAAIEIIEHIKEADKALEFIKRLSKKGKDGKYLHGEVGSNEPYGTVTFITSPNRNNRMIAKDKPKNDLHVREYTIQEALDYFGKWWGRVEPLNYLTNEMVPVDSDVSPVLYRCTKPHENTIT